MNIKLKVLSPLHIGCGEECGNLSHLIDFRKKPPIISFINEELLFKTLSETELKQFVSWLENEPYPNLFLFFKNIIRDNQFKIQNILQKNAIYSVSNYSGPERLKPINLFIKQMNKPYIPGTEIKGAVRTSILYNSILFQSDISGWLIESIRIFGENNCREINLVKNQKDLKIKDPSNLKQKLSDIKKRLENKISDITKELQHCVFNTEQKDAKYDVMKFLQISDSDTLDPDKVLAVSYVEPFNITREFKTFYEFIDPDRTPEITISTFTLEPEPSLQKKLKEMNFSEDQKRIVSGLDSIFKTCHLFSNDLLEEEIIFFQNHGKPLIAEKLEQIKSLNSEDAPVLRIGKDQGFNSLTVGLAVKKLAPELYEKVLIHATKNKSYDSEHGGPLPKSRKIVHWNDEETTAGWVQLIKATECQPGSTHVSSSQKIDDHQTPKTPVDFSPLQDRFKPARKNK